MTRFFLFFGMLLPAILGAKEVREVVVSGLEPGYATLSPQQKRELERVILYEDPAQEKLEIIGLSDWLSWKNLPKSEWARADSAAARRRANRVTTFYRSFGWSAEVAGVETLTPHRGVRIRIVDKEMEAEVGMDIKPEIEMEKKEKLEIAPEPDTVVIKAGTYLTVGTIGKSISDCFYTFGGRLENSSSGIILSGSYNYRSFPDGIHESGFQIAVAKKFYGNLSLGGMFRSSVKKNGSNYGLRDAKGGGPILEFSYSKGAAIMSVFGGVMADYVRRYPRSGALKLTIDSDGGVDSINQNSIPGNTLWKISPVAGISVGIKLR